MKLILCVWLVVVVSAWGEWAVTPPEVLEAPAGLEFFRVKASQGGESAELHVVAFNPKKHGFAVMDNPVGAFTLGTAAEKRGAVAAVNGGYFHPDRTPLGLVVRQGKELHPLEKAKLLSGLLVVTRSRSALLRVGEFKPGAGILEALQAGPFLVDGAKPVAGLNTNRSAARTVVFADDRGNFGILVCKDATLDQTAQILAVPGVVGAGRKVVRALNLDGGSSTGLWVGGSLPFYFREGKSVRNYLAVVPR